MDYEITVRSSALEEYQEQVVIHPQTTLDPRDHMHLHQFNDFVEAIRTGKEPQVTIRDGRRVLKVMDAVFESSRAGKPVNIG